MGKHVREDLTELFELWLDRPQAQAAAEEVRSAEQMMESHPAPLPAEGTLDEIRRQMQVAAQRRRQRRYLTEGVTAVAAAILVVAGLSHYSLQKPRNAIGLASRLPAALWETDDVASDDTKLAYFNSEVDRLQAQVDAIETGEADTSVNGTLGDVEMELFQIDMVSWKG